MIEYVLAVATNLLIWIMLTLSLNLVVGYGGMLHLGHIAFFGIGGYATGILVGLLGWSFWAGFIVGIILSLLLSLVIGYPALHIRGDYFLMVTLGFAEVIRIIATNWVPLTRGPMGIPGIPLPALFSYRLGHVTSALMSVSLYVAAKIEFFFFALLCALLSYIIIKRLVHSPFGRVLKAFREDDIAARSLGKNPVYFKVVSLMVAAAIASVAGSLSAHHNQFFDPNALFFSTTVFILVAVVLGGLGSLKGSVVGAAIVVLLPEVLRFLSVSSTNIGAIRQLVFSLALILLMLYRPGGLFHERHHA